MPITHAFIVPHPPLIVPEVGRGEEKKIQKTIDAYHKIAKEIADLNPDTIIISSPHSILYSDYFHISPAPKASGSLKMFGASNVKFDINYDTDLVGAIEKITKEKEIDAGTLGEKDKSLDHGTMVPLYFINQYVKDAKYIRLSLSGFSPIEHYRYGKAIKEVLNQTEKNVIWVASGDLSHKLKADGPYGLSIEGPIFDGQITKAISEADFMKLLSFDEDFCERAAECGLRSFIMMTGALDGMKVDSKLLSYEGPFGVGYAVASFKVIEEDNQRHFDKIYEAQEKKRLDSIKAKEDPYVRLARESLEYYIHHDKVMKTSLDLPDELTKQRAGVFVSIKMDQRLRGCIGTIHPTTFSIAEEIIHNAISSGTRDYRFNPVTESELHRLTYSVDVLNEPEDIESMGELDVKRYGVIVRYGGKSGLLLPNLEGIDTPEEQVSIALRKAGIRENQPYQMQRFEVIRHH